MADEPLETPRRPWWRWLLVLAGPVILVIVFRRIGVDEILTALRSVETTWVFAALALAVPALLLRTWRWRMLLGRDGEGMSYGEVTAIFAFAVFVGTATPGRLGEFMKVFHLHRRGVPVGRGLASVLLDRLLDVVMLLVMACSGIALLAGANEVLVAVAAVLAFVASIALARALVCGGASVTVGRVFAPITPRAVAHRVVDLRAGLCAALDDLPRGAVVGGTLLTLAAWGVNYLANYFLALSLGLSLTYFQVAGVSAVASLVVLLPVSVAGAGTRDMAMVPLLAAYSVARPDAVALSTLFLAFILWNAVMCSLSLLSPRVRLARS